MTVQPTIPTSQVTQRHLARPVGPTGQPTSAPTSAPERLGTQPGTPWTDKHLEHHAMLDGFDLHASVHVAAADRKRLEQLLRYCARPPISHDRLHPLGDGRLALELKPPWFDGTTHILLQPDELLQRLVALILRPQNNVAAEVHAVELCRSVDGSEGP